MAADFSYTVRSLCHPLFARRDRDRRYPTETQCQSVRSLTACCCRKFHCFIELRGVGVHAGTVALTQSQRTAVVGGISLGIKKNGHCATVLMCL